MELLKEGENNLSKYIDVYQMIKRFQEMENLKIILLNQQQLGLFNNITKPIISSKKKEPEFELVRLDSGTKLANLIKRYDPRNSKRLQTEIAKNILSNQKRNEVDERLLELMNDEMKEKVLVNANHN